MHEDRLKGIPGTLYFFLKMIYSGKQTIVIEKVVDDILFAVRRNEINLFIAEL